MEQRIEKIPHFASFLCCCMLLTLPGVLYIFPVVAAGQEKSSKTDNIIMDFLPLAKGSKDTDRICLKDFNELICSKN